MTPEKLADSAAALAAPFPPGVEQYRVGPTFKRGSETWGKPLPYIESRAVFDRLDAAVGAGAWSSRLERLGPGCYKCALTVCGVTREDVGMAASDDVEPEKSAASDAIKRAAVQFGIGRYLYALDLPPVQLEPRGSKFDLPRGYRPGAAPARPAPAPAPAPAIDPDNVHGLEDADRRTLMEMAAEKGYQPAELWRILGQNYGCSGWEHMTPECYGAALGAIPAWPQAAPEARQAAAPAAQGGGGGPTENQLKRLYAKRRAAGLSEMADYKAVMARVCDGAKDDRALSRRQYDDLCAELDRMAAA